MPGSTPGNWITDTPDRLMRVTDRESVRRPPFLLQPLTPSQNITASTMADDDIEQAILLIQDRDYTNAIPLLERALKRHPTVEAVWEALGWSYFGTGRMQDAEKLWTEYLTLRPDSAKAHSLLAQLAITQSDWHKADTYLSKSIALDPDNYDIRYWYAQNLFRLGRLDPAYEMMKQLVLDDPYRIDVKTDLARISTLRQEYEEAVDLWTDVVDTIPENLDFRTEYARGLMMVGSLVEADEQARQIIAEDPSRSQAVMIRADIAELSTDPATMEKTLLNLIDNTEDPAIRAALRVRLAVRCLRLHRKDSKRWPLSRVLEQYGKAVDERPDYVPWISQYAQIAVMARKPRLAQRLTDRILKDFNPYNHQALRIRIEIAMLEQDYDAAERALDEAYDRYQPHNPYRHFDRARIEAQRGRYFNAMDELDKLEAAGREGALLSLLYHGLTESEWMALTSTRRLYEHLAELQRAGFTFVAPSDIPACLGKPQTAIRQADDAPWLARQVDHVRYAFTGNRRYEQDEDAPLRKVAVVTFDDGLRTSFQLGTPVAEELGIPFWMAIITHIHELNAPMYAAWEEVREARESGAWEIGSHLMYANTDRPIGPDPEPLVFNLPNRVWLPDRRRLETLREWSTRIRNDFEQSRATIEKHLGLPTDGSMAVAYPYSEIGQAERSNVARLIDPIRTILNEAHRHYQVGFVVDDMGYTMPQDDIMMVRRYEPPWDADARSVVEHVMIHHPVMMARRMRAEIAALTDRPYLAERQVELLRRDGYPERPLRELVDFTQNRLPSGGGASLEASGDDAQRHRWLRPSNLYVAGAYRENQSNDDILQRFRQLRAGFNINPSFGIEGMYQQGDIDQTVTSNIWYTIQKTDRSFSTQTQTETVNGVTTTSFVQIESTSTRDVQTNRTERYDYAADVEEIRGALTLRLDESTTLSASFGEKTIDYAPGRGRTAGEESEWVGSISINWTPYHALQVTAVYDHDLVPSARQTISYDAGALNVFWKVSDNWDLDTRARYASLKDDNAMVSLEGRSMWRLIERQGIWAGIEGAAYSMDEDSDLYWSPYWDTRYAGVLRLRRAYPFYYFQFDARIGQQREDARPEAVAAYRNLRAQAESDGTWDAGTNPDADWDSFIGLSGTYRQRLWKHVGLFAEGTVNFLRDYSEHDLTAGLQVSF